MTERDGQYLDYDRAAIVVPAEGAAGGGDIATMLEAMLDWHADMHRKAMDADTAGVNRARDHYDHQRRRLLQAVGERESALAGALAECDRLRAALDLLKPLRRPEDWGLLAVRRADNEVRGVFRWPHETVDETIAHIRVHWPDGEIAGWVWVDAEAERRYRAALAPQSGAPTEKGPRDE